MTHIIAQSSSAQFRSQFQIKLAALTLCFALFFCVIAFRIISLSLGVDLLFLHLSKAFAFGLIFLFCCGLALSLFWLRTNHLIIYAIIEVSFGLTALWSASEKVVYTDNNFSTLQLLASIYIIIRGLDNLSKASKELGYEFPLSRK